MTTNQPQFINVDLELSSNENLSAIAAELGDSIYVLVNEQVDNEYRLHFECHTEDDPLAESDVIETLLACIQRLSSSSQQLLSNCHKKVLDIGYESGKHGWLYGSLSTALLTQVAEFGFGINISIYGIEPSNHN